MNNFIHSDLTEKAIKAFYNVYNELGFGFLEKVYENAMSVELTKFGIEHTLQKPIEVFYKKKMVGSYFSDICLEDKVVIELKAVSALSEIHEVQLVNYLKASNIEVGLLLNFGKTPEVKRRVLTKEFKNHINHNKSASI